MLDERHEFTYNKDTWSSNHFVLETFDSPLIGFGLPCFFFLHMSVRYISLFSHLLQKNDIFL